MASITVLGSGSWGCALAQLLHSAGHDTRLWGRSPEKIAALQSNRHPPGLPELQLPGLPLTADLEEALDGAEAAVLAIRSQAVSELATRLASARNCPHILVIASKGIDLATLRPLSEVIAGALPESGVVAVSGPCISREVVQGIPTSVVAACADPTLAERVQHWFATPHFRAYRSDDLLGVELGGALKNVIAIAAGVSDGLDFGANAKSALLSRGLAEIRRLACAMGANDVTITGLAGLGDLCVTCFSPHSRNRRFGEALGRGEKPGDIEHRLGEVVEGVPTARAMVRLAKRHDVQAPIAEAVTNLTYGVWSPKEAVGRLMMRELKAEFE